MKVVGRVTNGSVSFEAIHMKRGERSWLVVSLPDLTKCQRSSESALAQPTQEPVDPWSLMVHQVVRRSLDVGIVAVAASRTLDFVVFGPTWRTSTWRTRPDAPW